uniref:ATP-dependent DNA helicase DDM1 isoform X1 n=1 Tax=Tanacetum cinerariifolium TaxID=118510 RepID=A0A699GKD2_TANCI|nr:ATP-dependent DNA helicase DDM1 isoform X1 [Tanacetum cinerariifolium]
MEDKWFDFSGKSTSQEAEEGQTKQVVAKLHVILRHFLLKRVKEDVEHMLPRKKEIILYATLTEHQKYYHAHLVNSYINSKCVCIPVAGDFIFDVAHLLNGGVGFPDSNRDPRGYGLNAAGRKACVPGDQLNGKGIVYDAVFGA